MNVRNKERARFFDLIKLRFERCLEPALGCTHDAIRAHSVQRVGALELIAVDGHVYKIGNTMSEGGAGVRFEKTGIRQASTFYGFCNRHDTKIFEAIDTRPLSAHDNEQLFLLAYRAVTKELHSALQAAMGMHKLVVGGLPGGTNDHAERDAQTVFLRSWIIWRYRYIYYDKNICRGGHDSVSHSTFIIDNEQPAVAAAAFFFVDRKRYGEPCAGVALNVVPLSEDRTLVVFSYAKESSGKARRYIAPIMRAAGEARSYELSCLLLNRAENFFVSPRAVEAWSPQKRRDIECAFKAADPEKCKEVERTPEMMLFAARDQGV